MPRCTVATTGVSGIRKDCSHLALYSSIRFLDAYVAKGCFKCSYGMQVHPADDIDTLTYPEGEDGEANSIYNFLRNIGGSVGEAFITTVLERRSQFHKARLVEHLTSFDTSYVIAKEKISRMLFMRGLHDVHTDDIIYGELQRQSHMLASNDVFHMLSVTMLFVFSLIFLMKRTS